MAGNIFGRVASDTLGLSDIGKILSPKEFDKSDGDDYIMHEDGEKIYFVIKSKTDEYVFTNLGMIHVDGTSAISKRRLVKRHDFYYENVSNVFLETAGNLDLDVEIKFSLGSTEFSIDVDKKQIEPLKDLYKALYEIGRIQRQNSKFIQNGLTSLEMANKTIENSYVQVDAADIIENMTKFNFNWMNDLIETYNSRDFGEVFEKYINN